MRGELGRPQAEHPERQEQFADSRAARRESRANRLCGPAPPQPDQRVIATARVDREHHVVRGSGREKQRPEQARADTRVVAGQDEQVRTFSRLEAGENPGQRSAAGGRPVLDRGVARHRIQGAGPHAREEAAAERGQSFCRALRQRLPQDHEGAFVPAQTHAAAARQDETDRSHPHRILAMRRLILFAKRPCLGQVKTRLVPPLRAEQALDLYRAFLRDQLRFVRQLAHGSDVEVWFDGPWSPGPEEFPELAGLALREQGQGDLGQRLFGAFEQSERDGASATIAIGVDSPTLPLSLVLGAFAELERGAPAVLAPAADGGYVLIGMRRPLSALLRGVPWGTSAVLRATLARAREEGIDLEILEPWYDVDDEAALRRLARELVGPAARRAPQTARCVLALPGVV